MSDRHANEATNQIVEPMSLEDVTKMLQCPVCMRISVPPIYQCLTGHIICKVCRPKSDQCALCQSTFAGTRNYVCERLFKTVRLRCKYAEEGCGEVILGKVLKAHQATCQFRPVPCLIPGAPYCLNSIPFSKYLAHYKEVHEVEFESSTSAGFVQRTYLASRCYSIDDFKKTETSFTWTPFVHQFKGHSFFLWCEYKNRTLFICVGYFGSDADAKKFRVTTVIGDTYTRNGYIVTCDGPPPSIRDEERMFLCITGPEMSRFLKLDERGVFWNVKYEIKEVKTGLPENSIFTK